MARQVLIENEENVALAPAYSMAVTDVAAANTFGTLMENAVNNESQSQVIQSACVNQCCVMILRAGVEGAKKGI